MWVNIYELVEFIEKDKAEKEKEQKRKKEESLIKWRATLKALNLVINNLKLHHEPQEREYIKELQKRIRTRYINDNI